MGIFSKIFGSNKLELTDDNDDNNNETLVTQSDEAIIENKEPSPFLIDEEDEDVKNE